MSNVLARMQGISEMEFYRTADDLRTELSALLMRDKIIPKKWRYVITNRALTHVEHMMECMQKANNIYAYDSEELKRRKDLQQECIDCCYLINEVLQNAIRNVWWQTLHSVNSEGKPTQNRLKLEKHLTDIAILLENEERLLKGWKRSSKLLKH